MDSSLLAQLQDPASPYGIMDLVFAVYLIFGLIRGLFRGLPAELAGLVGTLLIMIGGWRFYRPVSEFIMVHTRLEGEIPAQTLAYILMVVLFLVTWNLLILMVRKLGEFTFPDALKRSGGALVGTFKSALILCVLLYAVNLSGVSFLKDSLITGTWFGRTTQQVIPQTLNRWLPTLFPPQDEPADVTPSPSES